MVSKESYTLNKRFSVKMAVTLAFVSILSLTSFSGAIRDGWAITELDHPSSWFINMNLFSRSAHSSLTCEVCHGTMKEHDKTHPDEKVPDFLKIEAKRRYDYSRCRPCHRQTYDRYLRGKHAEALKKEQEGNLKKGVISGKTPAPTCGDCHSAHYEKSHFTRIEIGRRMTETCGSCHLAQKVTYLEDYHGKTAVHLRYEASAFCTDCHGAHSCISLKEKKTALLICQRCHPKAEARFADFVIHPTLKDVTEDNLEKRKKVTVIKTVSVIVFSLVVLIIAFFYSHSFLWLLRELHEKLRKR